ncbi:hypothetical protein BC830DRAFT_1145680 [Chytriomyces sp. MP71]|nr:hypothetical protein BC830DRAFT_1145680 [Chytriomyces sp. MP71]
MEDFHISVQAEQQRKSLAARAEYLKKRLYGNLHDMERTLAPHSFGWKERPWTLTTEENQLHSHITSFHTSEYAWIGEHSKSDNIFESPEEAVIWEALRHAEARAFPLENDEVVENLFEGLESAMMAEDVNALSNQWQERPHYENGGKESKQISPKLSWVPKNLSTSVAKKRVGFGIETEERGRACSNDSNGNTGSSNSEDSETLFSLSAEPTPHGTPRNPRSRSVDTDRGSPTRPKSISQKRLEADLAARRAKEEMERAIQFRATPVPASSLLPRYDEIMRKMGNKSTQKRFQRANELMSKVKPFSFICNGDHSQALLHCHCKSQSNKMIQDAMQQIQRAEDDAVQKKSLYLLTAENSLAARAAEDGRRRRQRLLASERNPKASKDYTYRPKIKHMVPDFKKLQEEFESSLNENKTTHVKIIPEPFPGVVEHEKEAEERKRKRRLQEIKQTKRNLRQSYFRARETPTTMDEQPQLPFKETRSSILKFQAGKAKALELLAKVDVEEHKLAEMKDKEKERIAKIQARFEPETDRKVERAEELKEQIRRDQSQKERDYRRTLHKINEKLEDRLCLFEKVSIENAKKRARAQVEQILRNQRY